MPRTTFFQNKFVIEIGKTFFRILFYLTEFRGPISLRSDYPLAPEKKWSVSLDNIKSYNIMQSKG